jgi:1-acyl-sn-glycerol-3-phosphate acyltransferase
MYAAEAHTEARVSLPGRAVTGVPLDAALPGRAVTGVPLDDDWLSRGMLAIGGALGRYHRHRIAHLDRLGRVLCARRRAIVVANHVLDVIDPLLFVKAVYERYGVVPRVIGHRAWFRTPGLRAITQRYRVIPARDPEATARALHDDGLLMLFPGGAREAAVRDYHREPYRLKWEGRFGFLRLALEHDADLFFVGALGTEEMYYQSRLAVPELAARYLAGGDASRYREARVPFGLLGPHVVPGLFPFPAPITHVVSEPLDLGDRLLARHDAAAFAALHSRVWSECQSLLDLAVAQHVREHALSPTLADRSVRAGHAFLRRLGL